MRPELKIWYGSKACLRCRRICSRAGVSGFVGYDPPLGTGYGVVGVGGERQDLCDEMIITRRGVEIG
jgi:hypothetical protein